MSIEQVRLSSCGRTRILKVAILTALLTGCASSGAPAPIEQRQAADGRARSMPHDVRPRPPDSGSGSSNDAVQVIGLGDEPITSAPASGWQPNSTVVSRAPDSQETLSPPGPARRATSESDSQFAVANPAVVALLNRANRDSAAGRQGASAASLERAIKIEPGNAWLWHRLAQIRLKQNRPGEAASIAARSNSLAGSDDALRARNWRLIASVHESRGESVAAQAARNKAARLERGTS